MKLIITLFLLAAAAWGQTSDVYWTTPEVITQTFANFNSTNTKLARQIKVQRTGTITKIGFVYGSNCSQTITLSVQTGTGSPSTPSGTNYGASAGGNVSASAAGWAVATLGTPATSTAGDIVWLVMEWAGTAGSCAAQYNSRTGIGGTEIGRNGGTYASSTWSTSAAGPMAYVEYDDGSIQTGFGFGVSAAASSSSSINSTTTPDEVGNLWLLSSPKTMVGAYVDPSAGGLNGTASVQVIVGATETACASIGGAEFNSQAGYFVSCTAPIVIPAGTSVYITLRATNSTNSFRVMKSSGYSAAHRALVYPFAYYVQRTDAGAWTTDTAAVSHAVLPIFAHWPLVGGGFAISQ